MKILIIGGSGFIGPYLVRDLLKEGHTVALFNRGRSSAQTPPSISRIYGDRKDLPSFSEELKRIAPEVAIDTVAFTESDALGAVEAFKDCTPRMVVLSSMDVYLAYDRLRGIPGTPSCAVPLTEESELRTNLYPYRAQAEGEDDFLRDYEKILVERTYSKVVDPPPTILRLPAVYGPGDSQHRLFEYLKRMDDGRPYLLLDEVRAGWRWTRGYVENVAAAVVRAATDKRAIGRVYNIGEEEPLTEREWVGSIARAADWNGDVVILPPGILPENLSRPLRWEQSQWADTSRLRKELDFVDPLPRSEAMKRTVEWERSNPPEQFDPNQFDYALEDSIRSQ